jgi:hypothetical protein
MKLNIKVDLAKLGDYTAIAGVLVIAFAVIARISGTVTVFGLETLSYFIGGMALMLISGLAKLETLLWRTRDKAGHPEFREETWLKH